MDDPTTRLRALGYHQDLQDRWVHPVLNLWLMDPALMLELPVDQVDAFHDEAVWAQVREPARPLMDAELSRAVNQADLTWQGWVGHWSSPSGLQLTQADIEHLGVETLSTLEQRRLAWLDEHGRRRFAGCTGMAVMILWLGVGWAIAGSVTVWLIGMAIIAVASWLTRPVPWPPELDPDPPPNEAILDLGRETMGPDWHGVALLTAPIPWDGDQLHLLTLARTISVTSLHEHFTPDVFLRMLHALEPIDDADPESAA